MLFNKNRQKSQTALASITASLPEITGNQAEVNSNEHFIAENIDSAFWIVNLNSQPFNKNTEVRQHFSNLIYNIFSEQNECIGH